VKIKIAANLITTLTIVGTMAIGSPSPVTAQVSIDGNGSTTLEGTSGGNVRDTSCAGFIADSPNHQVKLDSDKNLRFSLEGAEDATLLILAGPKQRFCVQADKKSKKAEIPGRWKRGTYDVYVGSQSRNRASYKLTINPPGN
jgi:hypothetical protein